MDDRIANMLGALVVALGDCVRAAVESTSGHGLSAAAALTTVAAYPGETLDALRRTLGLSAPGASRLADRLQADGLIERQPGADDARSRVIVPTDAGHARARAALDARHAALVRALTPLSADERDQLAHLLEVMLSALTPDRETCDHTCRLCDIATCPQHICPVELAALRSETRGA
jgi:MarR family transcriptional regulator, negative regulator of the multidrug operon emrRAB